MSSQPTEEAYKVRACDNLVYGPVTLATLLDWARDERVVAATWIHCLSADSWQKAETIPAVREVLLEVNRSKSEPADSVNAAEEISADELRQFPRLAMLTDKQLEQVRRFGELRVALPGTRIIRKGDPGDALYLVLSGEVRVRLLVGMEDKTLFTIRPGQFFGEMAMFNDSPRSADVVAVSETRLMRVTQHAFLLFIEEIPELASRILYNLASTLADRLVAANTRFQMDAAADFVWR
jgi:CRP-like cAMP-binding protein